MSGYPRPIKIVIDENRYWAGLGRQNMAFHQTLGELIDNAISASGEDTEGDLLPFRIEILVIRSNEKISLTVADEGIGISSNELEERILDPGGQGGQLGPLNEHGFGLKNALCVMTKGNKLSFKIQTRDAEAVEKNLYYMVKGPFRNDMNVELDDPNNWCTDLTHCKGKKGTRIKVEGEFEYLRTLWLRAKELDTLMDRLGEHLGVMYRGYLQKTSNKMWLRWCENGNWTEKRIRAIEIPYAGEGRGAKTEKGFDIQVGGVTAKASFIYGGVDAVKARDETQGWPYPLKIYYQHNIPTTGIDIRVRDRVVLTKQLEMVWPGIHRGPDYNWFTGELILGKEFRTVNNKTALDSNNPFWQKLVQKLNSEDPSTGKKKYQPKKGGKILSEKEIRGKLASALESSIPNSKADENHAIWSGTGVRIDIHLTTPTGVEVYEVKSGTAKPLDVYQLLMYWDGVACDTNSSPKLGRLVADDAPASVLNIITDINQRKDKLGNNYNLEFKKIADWKIS